MFAIGADGLRVNFDRQAVEADVFGILPLLVDAFGADSGMRKTEFLCRLEAINQTIAEGGLLHFV